MSQQAIPYVLMRGGTSKGPYFNRADLPADRAALSRVLLAVMGAGNPLAIDGIGGGTSVTTKVAMLSPAQAPGIDVDYLFAQVDVVAGTVDYAPTCGNILCGVGAAAIELGLVRAVAPETSLGIRAVNTGARIITVVQTPAGQVRYDGDTAIDGVPGTAAPVTVDFIVNVGALSGALLPTGNPVDVIEGVPVTCIDVAVPMVIARAGSFGLSGDESAATLNVNDAFLHRMETVRQAASLRMGLGNAAGRVTPKFGLVSAARHGGTVTARYFVPHQCHPTMAVTGGQCIAASLLVPGSVSAEFASLPACGPTPVVLEHPSGTLRAVMRYAAGQSGPVIASAGLVRSCRKLAEGRVFIPAGIA